MKERDDCGAMGAAVINVYQLDTKNEYKAYIDSAAQHILYGQHRLADGTLCRAFPHKMTVWADDAYMSVSFLSQMGKLTGDDFSDRHGYRHRRGQGKHAHRHPIEEGYQ